MRRSTSSTLWCSPAPSPRGSTRPRRAAVAQDGSRPRRASAEGCPIRTVITALVLTLALLACGGPAPGAEAEPRYDADEALAAVRSFILTSHSDQCRALGRGTVASVTFLPASGAWEVRFTTSGEDTFTFEEATRQVSATYPFCRW